MSCYPNFEWYYFDLHSDNGYDVICAIHPTPFNSVFEIAIIDIYIYKDNEVLLHHFFVKPASDKTIQEDPFLLSYDKQNYIKKWDDQIEVKVKDETVDLSISFTDLLKIKNPQKNKLIEESAEGSFDWIVYAPFCEGQGTIKWNNQELNLDGCGYHDYNCGSGNLRKAVKYWYWGKYFFGDELFIYGEIVSKNNKTTKIGVYISQNGIEFDHQAIMSKRDNKIFYTMNHKKFNFVLEEPNKIDDIFFYMSGLPKALVKLVKVKELFFHIIDRISILSSLKKLLSNGNYIRYRRLGKLEDGKDVKSFYEEMYL